MNKKYLPVFSDSWIFIACMLFAASGQWGVFISTAFGQPPANQYRRKKPLNVPSSPSPSEGMQTDGIDADLSEIALNDSAVNSLQPGKVSIAVAFPNGGALTGTQAMGLRFMFSNQFASSFLLQYNLDKAAKKQAIGVTLKAQQFFHPSTRAVPFVFLQGTGGQNSGDGNTGNTDLQVGAAAGLGVEIFLIKELSTSAEIGIGSLLKPTSKLAIATATTQIGIHYHFGLGF